MKERKGKGKKRHTMKVGEMRKFKWTISSQEKKLKAT
jgi:hypothetical protein